MADFKDVVKSLKDNKTAQDDGFNRLEAAVKGTDPKSIQEEQKKTQDINTKKEQGYFARIGDEVANLNENFKGFASSLKSPEGVLAGLFSIIPATIALIVGFFGGIILEFKQLTGLFLKDAKWVKSIKGFFSNIDKGVFGKGGIKAFGDFIAEPFKRIFKGISDFFNTEGKLGQKLLQPFRDLFKLIKGVFTGGPIGKFIKTFMDVFSKISKFALLIGTTLGRIVPITAIVIAAVGTMWEAIKGFRDTVGNLGSKIAGFFTGALKGLFEYTIGGLADLLIDGLSWVAKKLGWESVSKFLDEKLNLVEGFNFIMDGVRDFFSAFSEFAVNNISWNKFLELSGIATALDFGGEIIDSVLKVFDDFKKWFGGQVDNVVTSISTGFDFVTEMAKSLQRAIHGGLDYIKGFFGFGDKSDFAEVDKSVINLPKISDMIKDALKGITDFFGKLFDFDFRSIVKSLPFGEKILSLMDSSEKDVIDKEVENQKKQKEIKDRLFKGDYGSFMGIGDSEEDLRKELAQLKADAADIRSQKNPNKLATANLAGVKPSDGSNFKDIDPSEMTEEQLKAAMIDYNKEKNKLRGGRRFQFDRDNKDLRRALSQRRRDFRDQREEEGNIAGRITQAQLDKIVVGGGGSSTVVNNTTNAPVNNNNTSSSYSPPTNPDPTIERAKMAAFR